MVAMPEKECPWCTIVLVALAMACHICVLVGNYDAAQGFHMMGVSSTGWSHVGLGLAKAMKEELNIQMGNVSQLLNEGIQELMVAQDAMDQALASIGDAAEEVIGGAPNGDDAAVLQQSGLNSSMPLTLQSNVSSMPASLSTTIPIAIGNITAAADSFLDKVEPALLLIGKWETTFGDKLQAGVEMFATAIDLVQKLFDQIMAQTTGGGGPDPYMEENTYTLFAMTDADKGIMVQDLKDVSGIYSITALSGDKAEDMHGKYDINKDGFVDREEYSSFVLDDSLPYIMAVVLRTYAARLTEVAGSTRSARMRDEVAKSLVSYLQLVSAKNMTKVGWIADLLSNGTLPLEFTADVMKNLALVADDPTVLTTADVGAIVVGAMTDLHAEYTSDAVNLMGDTDFWVSAGFDPADQPVCVDRVTQWMGSSLLRTQSKTLVSNMLRSLGGVSSGSNDKYAESAQELLDAGTQSVQTLGSLARASADASRAIYMKQRHVALVEHYHDLHRTKASQLLFATLLGGQMASGADPNAVASVNSGVIASNVTLTFMSFLAANASTNAQIFQSASFNYSSQSSNAMDSFATRVQGLVKKFQAFLNLMEEYSGEDGVARLRAKVKQFSDEAQSELEDAVLLHVHRSAPGANSTALREISNAGVADDGRSRKGSWSMFATMMETMRSVFPTCISNMKAAKDEVAKTDAILDSVFDVFEEKGIAIFDDLAHVYRTAWTAHFVLFALITMGILYYGLWAAGFMGGPKHTSDHYCPEYEAPTTLSERLRCCWASCMHCMWHHSETGLCFWSMLLLGQAIVLLMFVVSIVLIILAGVNMFLASGCAQVYVLGDPQVCTQNLLVILRFLSSFNPGEELNLPLTDMCANERLATCEIMSQDMLIAGALTCSGAIMSAVLTFMLLVESAVAHERARNRRMLDKFAQEGS